MSTPAADFEAILKAVARELRPPGFRRHSQNFYVNNDLNWGIVNFQRGAWVRHDHLDFTINVAISSRRIRQFEGEDLTKDGRPKFRNWHLIERVSHLFPSELRTDIWWDLDEKEDSSKTRDGVVAFLREMVAPAAIRLTPDAALRDQLMKVAERYGPGHCLFPLAILLKELGQEDALSKLIKKARAENKVQSCIPIIEDLAARLKVPRS